MRKFLPLFWALVLVMALSSCQRQKKCEYGQCGTWLYLEPSRGEVVGYFIPDSPNLDIDSVCKILLSADYFEWTFAFYPVNGYIPKEYRTHPNEPMRVLCTIEYFVNYHNYYGIKPSKILCIEKI
ncbi:MAG: hypothetical protein K5890_05475 [Bacteroidales bacterium]|nr:hypothetical protein [Bacteroidales bacterium]